MIGTIQKLCAEQREDREVDERSHLPESGLQIAVREDSVREHDPKGQEVEHSEYVLGRDDQSFPPPDDLQDYAHEHRQKQQVDGVCSEETPPPDPPAGQQLPPVAEDVKPKLIGPWREVPQVMVGEDRHEDQDGVAPQWERDHHDRETDRRSDGRRPIDSRAQHCQ